MSSLVARAPPLLAFALFAHEPRAFLAERLLLGVDARAFLGVRRIAVAARFIRRHARQSLRLVELEALEVRHLRIRRKRRRRVRRIIGVGFRIRTLLRRLGFGIRTLLRRLHRVLHRLVGFPRHIRLVAFLRGGGGVRLLALDEFRFAPVKAERAHQRAADTPGLVILRLAAFHLFLRSRRARFCVVPVPDRVFVRVFFATPFVAPAKRPSEG